MFVLGNFFIALARIADLILTIMMWLIFFRAIISFVNPDPYNSIVQFLCQLTEPILQPIRRVLPFLGRFDFSPMIAFIIIIFLQSFLVNSLQDLGYHLRRSTMNQPIEQIHYPSTK